MIDILILGLSSGLSFDSALDLYVCENLENYRGELSNAHMTGSLVLLPRRSTQSDGGKSRSSISLKALHCCE